MAPGDVYDVVIEGGTLHDSTRSVRADVAIRGERVSAVAEPGAFRGRGKRSIDATGMDVIPGAIDVHVHLALPFCGTVSCDDFESGSRAAASGCVTSLIDFAIPGRGQTLADAHRAWDEKSRGRSIVDYSWHLALTDRSHIAEIPGMVARGLPTFKEFMIYEGEGWNSDDAMLYSTLEMVAAQRGGAMLLLHAESPKILDLFVARARTGENMRRLGARLHATTRPPVVEVEAIERAIRFCGETGGRLYIVHMSTGEGADLVRRARARGVPVLAETCVQYLCLDDSVFSRPDGHLYACCPQVKSPADIERL